MMHKQHVITMVRPWPETESLRSHFRAAVAKLKQVIEIPMGYEDETGFHFGAEPAPKETR